MNEQERKAIESLSKRHRQTLDKYARLVRELENPYDRVKSSAVARSMGLRANTVSTYLTQIRRIFQPIVGYRLDNEEIVHLYQTYQGEKGEKQDG